MQQRRAATAELKAEQKRSKGGEEEGVEHAALAAVAPREAPDTGGASGSADVPPYLLPMCRRHACGVRRAGSATHSEPRPHAVHGIDVSPL